MNQRVLITGITGFTGQYLKRELEAAGWEVWGLGSAVAPILERYFFVDLADGGALQNLIKTIKPDAVIHLAAISFVGHGNPNAFYQVNLQGSRNLLAALANTNKTPQCVLLASSANVYGNTTPGKLSESTPLNPANDYAVSKLAMEYMAHLWQDRLPIVITRPFNYTGVGQSAQFLLPKIVAHFRDNAEYIELGNLDVSRDFSDVRAVATAYRRLIEVCPAGETINVCSGLTYSLHEIVTMMEYLSSHALRLEINPSFVRNNEVETLCGDATKLRNLIGHWSPPPLEETLRWMLEDSNQ